MHIKLFTFHFLLLLNVWEWEVVDFSVSVMEISEIKCDISNINLKVVEIERKCEVERAKGNGLVGNRIG